MHPLHSFSNNAIVISISIYSIFSALQGHDEVLFKRARHVITGIQRTRDAADALKKKDFVKVMLGQQVY